MKITQFIHPMFLTALGLHASLLFVPIGGSSEAELLEEDVPLAELTADPSQAVSAPSAPTKLPVPDLNVPTSGSPKAASSRASAQPKPKPEPTLRRVAPPSNATTAQSAKTGTSGAVSASGTASTPREGSSTASSGINFSAANNGISSNESQANNGISRGSNGVTTSNSASDSDSAPQVPTSFIPDLSAQDEEESITSDTTATDDTSRRSRIAGITTTSESTNTNQPSIPGITTSDPVEIDASEGESATSVENERLNTLIASASQDVQIPDSLEDAVLTLAEALVYRPEETKDAWAEQKREAWVNSVSRQASGASNLERVDPVVNSELTLEYPMATSVIREGRSLDVCLDEKPSKAEVGLLFNAQGGLVSEPEVLRSTGYEALDLEITSLLKEVDEFPDNRASRTYIYEVEIDYDAEKCISLSQLQSESVSK